MKPHLPLAVVGLALPTVLAGVAPAAATTAGTTSSRPSAPQHWITLVTGDRRVRHRLRGAKRGEMLS